MESLKLRVRFPVNVPLVELINPTVTFAACPAPSVIGIVTPETENCEAEDAACVSVMFDCPVLVTDSDREAFWPAVTLLNAKLNGVSCVEIVGIGGFVLTALITPEQPLIIANDAINNTTAPSCNASCPPNFFCLLSLVTRPKRIYVPSPDSSRVSEYVLLAQEKYWLHVQIRDRRRPCTVEQISVVLLT